MPISSAVDAGAVARVVGIKTEFKDLRAGGVLFLQQRIAVIGQGASAATYANTKVQHTSAYAVGQAFGFGSPLHLAAQQLMPANGDGVGTLPVTFYPLSDDGAGVASTGSITPSGAATGAASFRVYVNKIPSAQFVVASGDTVADICDAIVAAMGAALDLPMLAVDGATVVNLTSKWKGASANDLHVEVVATSEDNSGISFGVVQPTGGLVNPDVSTALDQIGNVWETMLLNCMNIADTATLDLFQTFGAGRWGALTHKPLVVFTGNTGTTVAAATAVSDARKSDYTNSQLVLPGSKNLPFVVAARELARIAVSASNNPARDFGSLAATGLTPGDDGDQWLYADRDQAVKAGSSTVDIRDGVPYISDVVTFYHPDGDALPPYRFVCDIVKIQNILYNLDLEFVSPEWDGAPLVPDNQPVVNPDAKQPKAAVAAACAIWDSLGNEAIISAPEVWKANTQAEISSINPKRLDMATTGPLSGNANINSFDFNFGFQFGG